MSDVFVSWGSPDASIANMLIERLRNNGLDVWAYPTSMTAGDDIPARVRREIRKARVVVVLVSPDTKDRPWVLTELILALDSRDREEDDVWEVLPVRLGGLPHEQLPDTVRMRNVHSFELSQGSDQEEALARLVHDIRRQLRHLAPLIVPAALLSMTRAEFRTVFRLRGIRKQLLESVCSKVGMDGHPKLRKELEQRYGDRPEDFAPFGSDPLTKLVESAQSTANKNRMARGQAPVYLRWLPRDAFKDEGVRELWQHHHSFLIVDSVSVFAPPIISLIQDLPHMRDKRNLAIMWVPPYTRHTVELESLIQASLQPLSFLADNFNQWRGQNLEYPLEYPYLAFDVATTTTLKRWVAQTLDSFSRDERPNPRSLAIFVGSESRGEVRPSRMFQTDGPSETS